MSKAIDVVGARDAALAAVHAFTEDTDTYWGPSFEDMAAEMLAAVNKARAILMGEGCAEMRDLMFGGLFGGAS